MQIRKSFQNNLFSSMKMILYTMSILTLLSSISCTKGNNNQPLQKVQMYIPHEGAENFQFMNFWVAQGLGLFEQEGIDLEVTVAATQGSFIQAGADIAIMPNPAFLNQAANGAPLKAFANTFQHDPANLIIRESIATNRGLSINMTLKQKLMGLQGLRVGVAQGPKRRLLKMFEVEGLDANTIIDIIEISGHNQNQAFEDDVIDAIFIHTPYLEHALINQGATLLIHNSKGEPAALSDLNIHLMVTTQNYLNNNEAIIQGITNALCKAQQIIKSDKALTILAIQNSGMTMNDPNTIGVIYDIYVDAIPSSPAFFNSWARGIAISATNPNLPITPTLAENHVERKFTEVHLSCSCQ